MRPIHTGRWATTATLLVRNWLLQLQPPEVQLQVPASRMVTPQRWCCPTDLAQDTPQTPAKPCVSAHPHCCVLCFQVSPHKLTWLLRVSSEPRCPLKPSCLLEFCIFSTPGHSCCFYTSFFNPCLHTCSWVKLQYLALSLVSKEWIPCTFLRCCSAQWLNTQLTNKVRITGNKCYLY